jgi:formate hydrogenlyase transcriptional activator
MGESSRQEPAQALVQKYRTLLAISEAIISHRDLPALLHDLAEQLHQVVRFDEVFVDLYDPNDHTMRLHVLETSAPPSYPPVRRFPVEGIPTGWVWKTQQPLIVPNHQEDTRWPQFVKQVLGQQGILCSCILPLTTMRHRLGTLGLGCKQVSAYDAADLEFLQQVANLVAVAVENALAFDQIEQLKDRLTQEKVYLEEELRGGQSFAEIVGESAELRRVLKRVETVAPTNASVFIRGETGTGKELIARALHQLSPRRARTFVKINCAAIPTGLLESELFGHEKGAFTGAIARRVGRFELADGGTLFLDEVGDIPSELQPKLLRVLQDQELERLGSTRTLRVDVRLVAATNRDLAQMVADGRFRSDLYYRLNVFPIVLPPLRERHEDIPRLVRHFTRKFARQMGKHVETIPAPALLALTAYPWPGNVRELENFIERAVILSAGPVLHVPLGELESVAAPAESAPATLAEAERGQILRALRETHWVVGGPNGAAARLGIKRSNLQWKMKRLGINRPR